MDAAKDFLRLLFRAENDFHDRRLFTRDPVATTSTMVSAAEPSLRPAIPISGWSRFSSPQSLALDRQGEQPLACRARNRPALRHALCGRAQDRRGDRSNSDANQTAEESQFLAGCRPCPRDLALGHPATYLSADPQWRTLIDLDALSAAEKKSWCGRARRANRSSSDACLVALSDGGEDAVTVREFNPRHRGVRAGRIRPSDREAGTSAGTRPIASSSRADWGPAR